MKRGSFLKSLLGAVAALLGAIGVRGRNRPGEGLTPADGVPGPAQRGIIQFQDPETGEWKEVKPLRDEDLGLEPEDVDRIARLYGFPPRLLDE